MAKKDKRGKPVDWHAPSPKPPVYSTRKYSQPASRQALSSPRPLARRRRKRFIRRDWLWVGLAGSMVTLFAFLIIAMFVLVRAPQASPSTSPATEATSLPTAVDARSEYIADGRRVGLDVLKLNDGSLIEMVPWDGQSRYTIIVAGLDRRDDQSNEPVRTDSLMLLSIDPRSKQVGLLSIPRDLWVEIPGEDTRDRINRAYFLGELRWAGNGASLLQQTVSLNFGMNVHNYVLLDFRVLVDLVDLLGGIEVTIDYRIDDERYPDEQYGYAPFYLEAGKHLLNGADALRFARTRHGNNDVLRAGRQQQVLDGIRVKLQSANFLELVVQIPSLLRSLSANLQTGLDLQQIIQLALFARELEPEDITMNVMNFDYLQEYITEEYQQMVLIPIVERLPSLLAKTFGEQYWG